MSFNCRPADAVVISPESERSGKMGKLIAVSGILSGLFVYSWDYLAGRAEIILGPKSVAALCVSGGIVVLGALLWRK